MEIHHYCFCHQHGKLFWRQQIFMFQEYKNDLLQRAGDKPPSEAGSYPSSSSLISGPCYRARIHLNPTSCLCPWWGADVREGGDRWKLQKRLHIVWECEDALLRRLISVTIPSNKLSWCLTNVTCIIRPIENTHTQPHVGKYYFPFLIQCKGKSWLWYFGSEHLWQPCLASNMQEGKL